MMFFWMGAFITLAAQLSVPGPAVQGVTIEGHNVEGLWQGLDEQGRIVLKADDKLRELLPSEISVLSWPATAPASQPAPGRAVWTVYLPDRSRFAAELIRNDKGRLTFRARSADELTLTLSDIAAIQFAPTSQQDHTGEFRSLLENRDPAEDTLIVLRDDNFSRLKGVTENLTADRVNFKWRNRSRKFATDRIFGLLIAAGVQSRERPPVQCFLRGDEVWAGTLVGGDRDHLVLELTSGKQIMLPVARLTEIRFRSDRVLFLSDLDPENYECEPFATTRWEWRRDRSVADRPLRIGDRTYARGIGMHSQSKLVFKLEPGYKQFAADIGIDEAVGNHGNVVMRILADGKEVYNSGPVTGRDEPKAILVPIENVKELTLAVDYGQELDVGDQADWANARLVK